MPQLPLLTSTLFWLFPSPPNELSNGKKTLQTGKKLQRFVGESFITRKKMPFQLHCYFYCCASITALVSRDQDKQLGRWSQDELEKWGSTPQSRILRSQWKWGVSSYSSLKTNKKTHRVSSLFWDRYSRSHKWEQGREKGWQILALQQPSRICQLQEHGWRVNLIPGCSRNVYVDISSKGLGLLTWNPNHRQTQ